MCTVDPLKPGRYTGVRIKDCEYHNKPSSHSCKAFWVSLVKRFPSTNHDSQLLSTLAPSCALFRFLPFLSAEKLRYTNIICIEVLPTTKQVGNE